MKLHLKKKSRKNNKIKVIATKSAKNKGKISNKKSITLNNNNSKEENYKEGLMNINNQEEKYDRLFEQKLAAQYREFRNIKENKIQSIKVFRIMIILVVIMILALLLMSY